MVQWPQVPPQNLNSSQARMRNILKVSFTGGIFTVRSKFRHANQRKEQGQELVCFVRSLVMKRDIELWMHCRDLASWGVPAPSPAKPISSRDTWCGERKVYVHRKFPLTMISRRICGLWWPTSWTRALRTRWKQMRNLWIYKWKRRMKNWTCPEKGHPK